jgi:hypothetical protein
LSKKRKEVRRILDRAELRAFIERSSLSSRTKKKLLNQADQELGGGASQTSQPTRTSGHGPPAADRTPAPSF